MTGSPQTCFYCGLHDGKVEAGGIWHCPNRFCQGPGGFYLRSKAGYHGDDGILTPEQEARMIADCAVAAAGEQQAEMKAAYQTSLEKMVARRSSRMAPVVTASGANP